MLKCSGKAGKTMTYNYRPKGVCSQLVTIEVEEGIIQSVKILGGCPGNTHGVAVLLKGMPVEEAIGKLEGIRCGMRSTSCPDQVAQALKKAL